MIVFAACAKEETVTTSEQPPAAATTSQAAETQPPMTHEEDVNAWKARRVKNLTSETGWLTLTGLYWLKEGENKVGAASDMAVRLPQPAPTYVGSLNRKGSEVVFEPSAGVPLSVTTKTVMKADSSGDPTIVKLGTITFQVIERGDRLGVRVKDANNEARRNFQPLEYYPLNANLRVNAKLEPYNPPKEIPIVNVLGMTEKMVSPGALVFTIEGKEYRLDPVLEEGETDLFIIFGDKTNGTETYGAGRYMYAAPPDASGMTVVDFNKAYNPPCVFTNYATCPLPPRQNKLPIRIEAGEKEWAGHEAILKAAARH